MTELRTALGIFSRRFSFISALIVFGVSTSDAQTPLHSPPPDKSNPCLGVGDAEGLASCGMVAYGNHDYTIARSAWSAAAARGDHIAAFWLAGLFQKGEGGEIDNVQAYKWYDIAAAIHGAEIDKLPPGVRENNQTEINYRDGAAEKLSPAQIAKAQNLAREWLARNPLSR